MLICEIPSNNDNNNNNNNNNIIIIRPEPKTGVDFANIGLELDIFRGNNGSAWIYLSFSISNE